MVGFKGLFNRISGGKTDKECESKGVENESDPIGSEEYYPLRMQSDESEGIMGGSASFDGLLAEGERPEHVRYLNPELDGADCIMRTKSGVMMTVRFINDPDKPDSNTVKAVLKAMKDNECTVAAIVSDSGFTEESVEMAMYLEVLLVDDYDFEKGNF